MRPRREREVAFHLLTLRHHVLLRLMSTPTLKAAVKKSPLFPMLKRMRSASRQFSHSAAQRYELRYARRVIGADWPTLRESWLAAKEGGTPWHGPDDEWFEGDSALWKSFAEYVAHRRCLEIGSGPFGWIGPADWIVDRVVIDPLLDQYRAFERQLTGNSFFDDVERISQAAELFVPSLLGTVDGCIICRNALDHAEDPLQILANIGSYAASGAYLLLWVDLWHLEGPNVGHRNITRSSEAVDALLDGLGFELIKSSEPVRGDGDTIEYGRVARKR